MSGRFVDSAIALAGVVAVLSLMTMSGAGQTPTAAEKAWNPPRMSDGQPDIQGFWDNRGRRLALYNIEEGTDEAHVLLSGNQTDNQSLVVDPPDGRIPYQSWARAKRQEVYELLESACYEGDRNMQRMPVQAR